MRLQHRKVGLHLAEIAGVPEHVAVNTRRADRRPVMLPACRQVLRRPTTKPRHPRGEEGTRQQRLGSRSSAVPVRTAARSPRQARGPMCR